MTLTTDELKWIDTRMEIYDIKYQEIYDEILDHVITAIEEKRKAGDQQDIKWLFQQVIDEHFKGLFGIENLAKQQEDIYRQGMQNLWLQSAKQYLTWPMLTFIVLVLLISLKLPDIRVVKIFLLSGCLLLAFSPVIYAYLSLAGKLHAVKGKKSLLKAQLITKTQIPAFLLNGMIYLPQLFFIFNNGAENWSAFKHIPLQVCITIMMFFVVLNLTAIRFCRKVIATKALT